MNKLLILGAGGHSKVVVETALKEGNFDEFFFLDDSFKSSKKKINNLGYPIIGKLEKVFTKEIKEKFQNVFVAIGDSKLREKWCEKLLDNNFDLPTLIHPTAYISSSAKIDKGSIILANVVIQSEVYLGFGCIVNNSASIDHETIIGKYVHVCPGVNIAGKVKIGNGSWVGIGASLIQNIKIGSNVLIGAGSVVISNIDDESKAVGVPAKVL